MSNKKEYSDRPDIKQAEKDKKQNIHLTSGVDNAYINQIKPHLQTTSAEKVIDGTSNCLIVLGNDRPGGVASGNGGIGATGAASIDIIVGLQGSKPIESAYGQTIPAQKDFKNDSARIYLSQRCDLDKYFEIPNIVLSLTPTTNINTENLDDTSGIGIKADHIRMVARENIKIVTSHLMTNNLGDKESKDGVSLIAGYDVMKYDNSYNLEPMVRGNKLVNFLEKLIDNIQNVQANINTFMKYQAQINQAMLTHKHLTAQPGAPTSTVIGNPIIDLMLEWQRKPIPDSIYNTIKNELTKQYFNPISPDYINSKWHKLN